MDKFIFRTTSTSDLATASRSSSPASKRSADETGWRLPSPKKTSRPRTNSVGPRSNIPTSNRYGILNPDVQASTSKLPPETEPLHKVKNVKIPPINIVLKQDWTHGSLTSLVSKYSTCFHLKYVGNNKVAVYCNSIQDHQKLLDGLKNEAVAYHTYSRKDEKPYKVVVRGLPHLPTNDLRDEIVSLGFDGVTVSKLKSAATDKNKPEEGKGHSALYLLIIPAGSDITKFRRIKHLCHCVIQIQKFKPNSALGTQCYRCQGFGHASRNCNLPVRCVKCTAAHATKDCPKKDRESAAKCCNCNEDHPANYRGCNERIKYLDKFNNTVNQNRKSVPNKRTPNPSIHLADEINTQEDNPNQLMATRSWANIARGTPKASSSNTKPKSSKPASSQQEPSSNFLIDDPVTTEMLNLLTILRSIKNQFTSCTSTLDKFMLILTHLSHYV